MQQHLSVNKTYIPTRMINSKKLSKDPSEDLSVRDTRNRMSKEPIKEYYIVTTSNLSNNHTRSIQQLVSS